MTATSTPVRIRLGHAVFLRDLAPARPVAVQLAGDAWYFGELHKKPFIGDDLRPIEPEDITRVNRMMYAAAVLALVVFGGLKLALLLLI